MLSGGGTRSGPSARDRYDAVPDSGGRGVAVWRTAFAVVGVAMLAWGVYLGITRVPSSQWLGVLVWLAGGIVVHDVILAPIGILVGLLVLPRVPASWRPALRGGMLALGVLAIFAVALFFGAAGRRNPSAVPQDPVAAVVVALVVIAVGVVVAIGWRAVRSRLAA
ncbi:hypothetical protein GCM10025865_17770 [Paraoerskovia sediminicola]|uniref:Uncharacterized protein n=1 Tax=Paraoerskovia sediminicola TaxID=1138587 RepID=A0ABM8G379_9CELL|nr:hypothetical protein [Paraoerskovia sediminicola]BDZ42478.1 hypothetical protein GCM10025865_17770 [Paraoerskovia sediminicola]